MLGRMRMDVESCKSYYVSLTRFVFITDKTLLGVPYGKTLFKASRLEEAIKHCVRESTGPDQESTVTPQSPPLTEAPPHLAHRRTDSWRRRRRSSTASTTSAALASPTEPGSSSSSFSSGGRATARRGNPEAPLLDSREGACKTFVTAMLQGSRKGTPPVLLRSYPSPVESVPSYRTTIWQAGRATCATAAAFKSVTIDQTTFLDEGAGMYNPALQVLDEAHLHEFADCDIATFVSVGTGRRLQPPVAAGSGPDAAAAAVDAAAAGKREWWEGMALEGFTEAKRRLVRRIDDCERVHRELVDGDDGGRPKLAQGGVAAQDYYRFNAEVGVGEFGMNEWNRLAAVATGTRRYLSQRETGRFVKECAAKLVAIAASRAQPQAQAQAQAQPQPQPAPRLKSPPLPRLDSPPLPQLKSPPPLPHQPQSAPMPPPPPRTTAAVMPDEKAYKPAKHVPSHFPPAAARPADAHHPAVRSHPAVQQQQQQQKHQPHGKRPGAPPAPPASSPSPQPPLPPPKPPQMAPASAPGPAPAPVKAPKEGKVLIPATEQTYYADDTPNPEVRLTSPTTVAGGSDDDDDDNIYSGYGRRRRRSRSRGRSLAGVME